jgi:methionyl-tRNA formyltransferase
MNDAVLEKRTTPRVLFFGKKNCNYSLLAVEHLRLLGFDTQVILSEKRGETLPDYVQWWSGHYIFCFRSHYLLRSSVLSRASIAAINFHPASVEYPGSGCVNWALYDRSDTYGVTAHIMNERIDNGAIIECRRFPVLEQDDVSTLLSRTHLKTFDLLVDITSGLALGGEAWLAEKLRLSRHEKWSGAARRMSEIDRLQVIAPTCSKDELERIIRATYTPDFAPEIHLHGYRFVLKK